MSKQGFFLHTTLFVKKIQCTKQRNSRKRVPDSAYLISDPGWAPSHPAMPTHSYLHFSAPRSKLFAERAPAARPGVVRILHGLPCTSQPTTAAHHLAKLMHEMKGTKDGVQLCSAVHNQPTEAFVRSFDAAFLNPSPLSCDAARSYVSVHVRARALL